jgi:hypothetical protein
MRMQIDGIDQGAVGIENDCFCLIGHWRSTVPVNCGINTDRKRAFFNFVKDVTGS